MAALSGAETIVAGRWLYGKLAAIASTYPAVAARGATMPYIIYQSFPRPDGDVEALGGTRVLARLRFLVKIESPTQSAAEPIDKAIDAAINGQTAQQDGYTILNVRRREPFSLPTVEGDDLYWQIGGYYDLEVCQGAA